MNSPAASVGMSAHQTTRTRSRTHTLISVVRRFEQSTARSVPLNFLIHEKRRISQRSCSRFEPPKNRTCATAAARNARSIGLQTHKHTDTQISSDASGFICGNMRWNSRKKAIYMLQGFFMRRLSSCLMTCIFLKAFADVSCIYDGLL